MAQPVAPTIIYLNGLRAHRELLKTRPPPSARAIENAMIKGDLQTFLGQNDAQVSDRKTCAYMARLVRGVLVDKIHGIFIDEDICLALVVGQQAQAAPAAGPPAQAAPAAGPPAQAAPAAGPPAQAAPAAGPQAQAAPAAGPPAQAALPPLPAPVALLAPMNRLPALPAPLPGIAALPVPLPGIAAPAIPALPAPPQALPAPPQALPQPAVVVNVGQGGLCQLVFNIRL